MNYGANNFFTANKLKIIAMALMLLDHFLVVFLPEGALLREVLRVPGRIVAPVICFFIAEGYHHTSNRKKYILRLFALALVSHIPFNITFDNPLSPFSATSVIWALTAGLAALTALKSDLYNLLKLPVLKNKNAQIALKLLILAVCCAAAYTANWNYVAVLWIAAFGLFHGSFKRQMIAFCVIGIVFLIAPACLRFALGRSVYLHWFHIGIFLAIPLLMAYNGKLGKKLKVIAYSFYVFYPAHLLLLYLLNKITPLAEIISKLL